MITPKTKKTPAKKATKKSTTNSIIYWVISKRQKLFSWEPLFLFQNREDAEIRQNLLESAVPTSYRNYKLSRVVLQQPQ